MLLMTNSGPNICILQQKSRLINAGDIIQIFTCPAWLSLCLLCSLTLLTGICKCCDGSSSVVPFALRFTYNAFLCSVGMFLIKWPVSAQWSRNCVVENKQSRNVLHSSITLFMFTETCTVCVSSVSVWVCYLSWVPGRLEILWFSSMERPCLLLFHQPSDDRHQPAGLPPGDTWVSWCADKSAARRAPSLCPDSQVLCCWAALNMAPALCAWSTDMLAVLAPHSRGSVARKFHYNTCPASPCLRLCSLHNLSDRCALWSVYTPKGLILKQPRVYLLVVTYLSWMMDELLIVPGWLKCILYLLLRQGSCSTMC